MLSSLRVFSSKVGSRLRNNLSNPSYRCLALKSTSTQPSISDVGASGGSELNVDTLSEIEDDHVQFSGMGLLPVTSTLDLVNTAAMDAWPVFRLLGKNGTLLENAQVPGHISKEEMVSWYKEMIAIQALDDIFYNAQRQGRISFYMQNRYVATLTAM